jgi:hypothetical protein
LQDGLSDAHRDADYHCILVVRDPNATHARQRARAAATTQAEKKYAEVGVVVLVGVPRDGRLSTLSLGYITTFLCKNKRKRSSFFLCRS